MVDVSVCVGSSCHLKGSYQVIQRLQELIVAHNLADHVRLSGSFCLSACGKGVTLRINGTLYNAASLNEAEEIFHQHILPLAGV